MLRTMIAAVLVVGLAACGNDEAGSRQVADAPRPDPGATPVPEREEDAGLLPRPAAPGQEHEALPALTGEEDAMACDASKAQWAVGEAPTDEILQRAAADAGAEIARYLRHDQMVTLEYHESRLNIDLDEDGVISGVRCG